MVEPTPIRKRRSKRTMAAVVGEAEVIGVRPAARKNHVPESSVRYWRDQPDFAQLRAEKKEDVAADVWAAFQKGVRRIAVLMETAEDLGKVAVASGILYDKFALMSGDATARTETKTLTDGMNDHEREALRKVLEEVVEVEA